MLRLMIEFRNSIKKSKDGLRRISLNVFAHTGINSDQKYSNRLKNGTESWVTSFFDKLQNPQNKR